VALNRYVVTADTTVAAGTPATAVAGEPGTGGAAGYGGAPTTGGPPWPVSYRKGTPIVLDPAGPLFTLIGSGNLRAFVDGQDAAGRPGISN
jgi:hypothetical protein